MHQEQKLHQVRRAPRRGVAFMMRPAVPVLPEGGMEQSKARPFRGGRFASSASMLTTYLHQMMSMLGWSDPNLINEGLVLSQTQASLLEAGHAALASEAPRSATQGTDQIEDAANSQIVEHDSIIQTWTPRVL